jgi:hypothetical protein
VYDRATAFWDSLFRFMAAGDCPENVVIGAINGNQYFVTSDPCGSEPWSFHAAPSHAVFPVRVLQVGQKNPHYLHSCPIAAHRWSVERFESTDNFRNCEHVLLAQCPSSGYALETDLRTNPSLTGVSLQSRFAPLPRVPTRLVGSPDCAIAIGNPMAPSSA